MLPYLRDRPVNMQRFPDGIGKASFYEKKVPSHFPDWVRTVEVHTADGPQRQVVVDDRRSLVYLAQQACLTPHTWLSRAGVAGLQVRCTAPQGRRRIPERRRQHAAGTGRHASPNPAGRRG